MLPCLIVVRWPCTVPSAASMEFPECTTKAGKETIMSWWVTHSSLQLHSLCTSRTFELEFAAVSYCSDKLVGNV